MDSGDELEKLFKYVIQINIVKSKTLDTMR